MFSAIVKIIPEQEQPASVAATGVGMKDLVVNRPGAAQGGAETFVFTDNWSVRSEDLISMSVSGAISLVSNVTVAQIDYQGVMPVREDFGFSFVYEGVNPNVMAGRPEFWEAVIGDNDNSVVSLRATDKIGGRLEPVPEHSGSLRPQTSNCRFLPGEEIRVEFSESFTQSSNLFNVEVTVTCNDGFGDTFRWAFTPPPKWTDREKFYLGLMDLDGSNQTKIHFIEPKVLYISAQ